MNEIATTKETTPATPSAPKPVEKAVPTTYEDCSLILDAIDSETNIDNIKAQINKIKGFFKTRLGKKRSDDQKDGSHAVKAAITSGRKPFEKYLPKEVDAPSATSPWS